MSRRSSACCASTGGRPAALSSSPIAPLSAPPPPCGPSLRTAARDGQDLRDTPWTAGGSAVVVRVVGVVVLVEHPGGVGGGLRPAFHAQLGEQRGDVVFDRFLGQ